MSKYGFQHALGMFTGTTYETLTLTTAASTGFSVSVYPTTVLRAFVTVETANIRYRYDAVAPTVSTGHLLGSGDVLALIGLTNIKNFQAICSSGASATLQVTYEVGDR